MKRILGITFYSRNSGMHGAVEFHTRRWGWIVVQPPVWSFGRFSRPCMYASPDATPGRATFSIGQIHDD